MKNINYIIGNSKNLKKIFKKFNLNSPNLIITSPPYFDVLNYENNKNQIGFGQKDYNKYLEDIALIFQDCYYLSDEKSTFWLIVDTLKKNGIVKTLPFDINNKLNELFKKTWILKEIIIWNKQKNLPWNSKGKFKNQFEYILFFTKNSKFTFNIDSVREINDLKKWWITYPERYNPNGKAPSNIWDFTTPIRGWGNGKQNHLCPFPFSLAEKIIRISSNENDVVFDPFAGSGSLIAIAGIMNRIGIGIDINKKYKDIFYNEVLQGAEEYWIKRLKELNNNNKLLNDFMKTNYKLRKLKVATNIISEIFTLNNKKYFSFILDKEKNVVDIVLIKNNIPEVNIQNKKLNKLIYQSKIIPNIIILSEDEINEKLNGKIFYKYKIDKFFSYITPVKFTSIIKNDKNKDYIYSDIEIKII